MPGRWPAASSGPASRTRAFQVITLILALVGVGLALFPLGVRALGLDTPADVAVVAASADVEAPADALARP